MAKQFDGRDSPMFSLLEDLGVDFAAKDHRAYIFKSAGFMDLYVETWFEGSIMKVSVCHYGEQNGDLTRDPEMVYMKGGTMEIPMPYRNDYVGRFQDAYPIINNKQMICPELIGELRSFSKLWARNIRAQGHSL